VFEHAAGGGSPDAGRIEQILERDRHAVERPAPFAFADLCFGVARLLQSLIGCYRYKGIHHGIQAVDAGATHLRQFHRRHGLSTYHGPRFVKAEPRKIASRPAPDQQATGSGAERNFKKRASSSHVPRQSGGYPRGPNSTDQLPLPLLVLPPLPFLVLPDDSR